MKNLILILSTLITLTLISSSSGQVDVVAPASSTTYNISGVTSSSLFATDTTDLKGKSAVDGKTCFLRGLTASSDIGAGWFVYGDSSEPEGGIAFDAPETGKQWVRQEFLDGGYVSIRWYGIHADGVNDDRSNFLNAIRDAKLSKTKTLKLSADTFYVSGTFNISGLTIDGNGAFIKGDGLSQDGLFYSYGNNDSLGLLSESAKKGDLWVKSTVASQLSVGDLIRISSSEVYGNSNATKGEIHLVNRIVGNTIYLDSRLFQSYDKDSSAAIHKLSTDNVNIYNLTIKLPITNNGTGIVIKRTLSPRIDNVKILRASMTGILLNDCFAPYVNATVVNNEHTGSGYGVAVIGGTYGRITGVYLNAWHAVSFGGVNTQPWGWKVFDCVGSKSIRAGNTLYVFDQHAEVGSVEYDNCTAYGVSDTSLVNVSEWDNATSYSANDTVYYDSEYYIAAQANIGQNPSTDYSQDYWYPYGSFSRSGGWAVRGGGGSLSNCKVYNSDYVLSVNTGCEIDNLIINNLTGCNLNSYGIIVNSNATIYKFIVNGLNVYGQTFRQAKSNAIYINSDVTIKQWEIKNIHVENLYGISINSTNVPDNLIITNYTGLVDSIKYRPDGLSYNIKTIKQKNIKLVNCNFYYVGSLLEYGNGTGATDLKRLSLINCDYIDRNSYTKYKIKLYKSVDNLIIDNCKFRLEKSGFRNGVIELTTGNRIYFISVTNSSFEGHLANNEYTTMFPYFIYNVDANSIYYFYQNGNFIDGDNFSWWYSTNSPRIEIINGSVNNNITYCRADTTPTMGWWPVGAIVIRRSNIADSTLGWINTNAGSSIKGTWSSSETYYKYDRVLYYGVIYEAVADGGQAEAPNTDTDHTYWHKTTYSSQAIWKKFGVIY